VTSFPSTNGYYYYRVRFLIREISGIGSAIIQRVVVTSADGVDDTGPWCWGDTPIGVSAGKVLDVFQTDAGVKILGDYCAPYVRSRSESFRVNLRVTFTDDLGNEGAVETDFAVEK
jgi:hypothetical protein